jgi:predicted transcriptional regulator
MQAVTSSADRKFVNRNRLEILAELLEAAKPGTFKTHLMYKGNLTYMMLIKNLRFLEQAELITQYHDVDSGYTLFRTTPKGLKFVEAFQALVELAGMLDGSQNKSQILAEGTLAFSW